MKSNNTKIIIYEVEEVYKIVTFSQAKTGIWIASGPFVTIDRNTESKTLFDQIMRALKLSKKNINDKDSLTTKEFYEKLGLKKGVKIEKIAKSFQVKLEDGDLQFIPTAREDNNKYYVRKLDDIISLSVKDQTIDYKKIFEEVLRKCD